MRYLNYTERSVYIVTTDACDMYCAYCINQEGPGEKDRLVIPDSTHFFRSLKDCGFRAICLTGGEPLLNKDLLSYILAAHESDLYTVLATNGKKLEENMVEKLASSGLSELSFSADDMSSDVPTKNKMAIDRIVALSADSPIKNRTLTYVLTSKNYSKIPDIIKFARKYRMRLIFQPIKIFNREFESLSLKNMDKKDLEELFSLLKPWADHWNFDSYLSLLRSFYLEHMKLSFCHMGIRKIVITADGRILDCFFGNKELGSVRNITDALANISREDGLISIRKRNCFDEACIPLFANVDMEKMGILDTLYKAV